MAETADIHLNLFLQLPRTWLNFISQPPLHLSEAWDLARELWVGKDAISPPGYSPSPLSTLDPSSKSPSQGRGPGGPQGLGGTGHLHGRRLGRGLLHGARGLWPVGLAGSDTPGSVMEWVISQLDSSDRSWSGFRTARGVCKPELGSTAGARWAPARR